MAASATPASAASAASAAPAAAAAASSGGAALELMAPHHTPAPRAPLTQGQEEREGEEARAGRPAHAEMTTGARPGRPQWQPMASPFELVHLDDALVVVQKPSGFVVHREHARDQSPAVLG